MSYLFEYDFKNTWDGAGHWALFKMYRELAQEYLAEGYNKDWFGGFAVFRYYTPFFYFLGSGYSWLGFGDSSGFTAIVLTSIALYFFGYYYFIRCFLPWQMSATSLLLYLSFQGTSQISTSLNGIQEGNYNSILGSGLVYLSLGFFFRWRIYSQSTSKRTTNTKNNSVTKSSISKQYFFLTILTPILLGYTHYLGFIFYYFIISFYFIWNGKEIFQSQSQSRFRFQFSNLPRQSDSKNDDSLANENIFLNRNISLLAIVIIPILISLPSLWGPVFELSESLGEALILHHPFLKNFIGDMDSQGIKKILLYSPYKLIPLLAIFGLFLSIRNKRNLYFFTLIIASYSIIHDISWIQFFPGIKIHFYRLWDILVGLVFFLGIKGLWEWKPNYRYRFVVLFLGVVNFFFYQPPVIQNHFSEDVESKLINQFTSTLEKNASGNILMESTTGQIWNQSPHRELPLLKKSKAPSLNGLIVESSWIPYVNRLYLPLRHENDFQWGFLDPIHVYKLPPPSTALSELYLREQNVQLIVGKTKSFLNNFKFLNQEIESIGYYGIISPSLSMDNPNNTIKMIGLVSEETKLNDYKGHTPENFFIESYLMQLKKSYPNSNFYPSSFPQDLNTFKSLNKENSVQEYYIDLDPVWSKRNRFLSKYSFDEVQIYNPKTHEITAKIDSQEFEKFGWNGEPPCNRHIVHKSFTQQLELKTDEPLFRNQFNQIYLCTKSISVPDIESKIIYPKTLARIKYFTMHIVFYLWLVGIFSLLYRKIKFSLSV